MNLLKPNTDQISNYYDKGKFLLAWRLILLFAFSFTMLSIIAFTSSHKTLQGIAFLVSTLIAISSLVYLKKSNNFERIYYIIAFSGCIIVFLTLNGINNILHFGNFLWQVLIVMITFFGLGKKHGFAVSTFVIFNIIYYFIFSVEENINHINNLTFPIRLALIIEITTAILSIAYIIHQFVIIHDYANKELQHANKSLVKQNKIISDKNKENITLIQEVHHRVKNNLQIVISLLRLQKSELKSEEAKKQFTEAINRVMVMASIHQKLYKDKSFTKIVPKDYFTQLTNDIVTLSSTLKDIEIRIDSEVSYIGLKTIVPLGLIVNELVSNSIQHAFSKDETGIISITISEVQKGRFNLTYKDSGVWLEPEKSYSSFGLELISILTSQLEGTFERSSKTDGTEYSFDLKNLD